MVANNNPEVLAGLVERVTFHNEDNGFCVLRVKARGKREPITGIGHAAVISAGEFIQASGEWANDRTHGVQFRARFLKTTPPTTTEGIEKYLGSGMIRGIGPVCPHTRGCWRCGAGSVECEMTSARGATQTRPTTVANSDYRGDADEICSTRVLLTVRPFAEVRLTVLDDGIETTWTFPLAKNTRSGQVRNGTDG